MIKHYYKKTTGIYLGQFEESDAPKGSSGINSGPRHALQVRQSGAWIDTPELLKKEAVSELEKSDIGMIRAFEDLRDVLIQKGIVSESDFTPVVQAKFTRRKTLRGRLK